MWLALMLALMTLPTDEPCAPMAASRWHPSGAPDHLAEAVFARAQPTASGCAVPVCHARVSGTSGGFIERDIPDVAIELVWGDTKARGRGPDDAREAYVLGSFQPIVSGTVWSARIVDVDPFSSDELASRSGVFDGTPVSSSDRSAELVCRFLAQPDYEALKASLVAAIASDAQALAKHPGANLPTLERAVARLDLLVTIGAHNALGSARDALRAGLEAWAPRGSSAAVGATGVTLTYDTGSLIATRDAGAKGAVTFSHMQDPYGFSNFDSGWIDLGDPQLAHGSFDIHDVGAFVLAPGSRTVFETAGPDADGRDLIVYAAWQKGFFGAPHPFVLRK